MIQNLKDFIIWWNNTFPLDKKYRDKYNIAFGSEEHRKVCQIDVLTEFLENKIYEDALQEILEDKEKEEQLKKGILIKEHSINTEKEQELIDNLSIDSFKNIKLE